MSPSEERIVVSQRPPGLTSISQTGMVTPFGPHHFTRRLGSAKARNTCSGFAGKRRTSFSSRSAFPFAAAFGLLSRVAACAMTQLLPFLAQIVREPVQARRPEGLGALHPLEGRAQTVGFQAAKTPLRLRLAPDESRALEHRQMLRDGRQGHVEGPRQLPDGRRPFRQPLDDGAAGRIGERGEGAVQQLGGWVQDPASYLTARLN